MRNGAQSLEDLNIIVLLYIYLLHQKEREMLIETNHSIYRMKTTYAFNTSA